MVLFLVVHRHFIPPILLLLSVCLEKKKKRGMSSVHFCVCVCVWCVWASVPFGRKRFIRTNDSLFGWNPGHAERSFHNNTWAVFWRLVGWLVGWFRVVECNTLLNKLGRPPPPPPHTSPRAHTNRHTLTFTLTHTTIHGCCAVRAG
jgi:hypothetical protein